MWLSAKLCNYSVKKCHQSYLSSKWENAGKKPSNNTKINQSISCILIYTSISNRHLSDTVWDNRQPNFSVLWCAGGSVNLKLKRSRGKYPSLLSSFVQSAPFRLRRWKKKKMKSTIHFHWNLLLWRDQVLHCLIYNDTISSINYT